MKFESKKGAVLLYVIMIFCLLTILGGGLITLTNHNTRMTQTEIRSEQAYQSALSGLEYTLDSFEKDPVTGQGIANEIRGGAKLATKLELDDLGTVKIELSCAEGTPCKKIKVESSATVKGLTKSVEGYLNIIEGGFGKPVNVTTESIAEPNDPNMEYCLFPEENGSKKCMKSNRTEVGDFEKFPNETLTALLPKYINYYTSLISITDKTTCDRSKKISTSCRLTRKEAYTSTDQYTTLTVDNSKDNIFIHVDATISNLTYFNVILTNPDSANAVVFLVGNLTLEDVKVGESEKDADNILFLGAPKIIPTNPSVVPQGQGQVKLLVKSKASIVYGWFVMPSGGVVITGSNGNIRASLYGGVYAEKLKQERFSLVSGVQPSSGVMGVLSETGIEPVGGGGAMTFAKTYDK